MKYDLVVRSRRTVLPDGEVRAALAVKGDQIAAVERYDARLAAVRDVDLGQVALLPGLVDTHVHVNEPGRPGWDGFAAATAAAAAGGVTTILDMPVYSLPPTVSVISSPQVSLPVVWTVARRRGRRLADLTKWMAERPAALAGLPGKGRLATGCDADLVAFDAEAAFTVRAADMRHRHPVTPYEGRVLVGAVRAVWLRGKPVTPDAPPRGRLIVRGGRVVADGGG